ncbi:MAG: 50S ribosomal protein L20 [Bacilli bacterium]
MRVKGGTVRHANRKRIMKRAEGYFGGRHRLYKTAKESVMRADWYAFNGRKERKQDYRKLWIRRISAACKANDISYSQFMFGLKLTNVALNRKMLSELAATNPAEFKNLVDLSTKAIADNASK